MTVYGEGRPYNNRPTDNQGVTPPHLRNLGNAPTTSNNVFNTGSTDDQLNTSASATSNISNKLDGIFEPFITDYPQFDSEVEQMKQALTAYIQQEKSALLKDLLEQKRRADDFVGDVYVVRVTRILDKLQDLNQGGEADA